MNHTIRQKFEKFYSDQKQIPLSWVSSARYGEDYSDPYGNNPLQAAWVYYKRGYNDLIEAMHVVGYRYYVEEMDYWEFVENLSPSRICYPVYAFPEDEAK